MKTNEFKTHLGAQFVAANGERIASFQMVLASDGKAYATADFTNGQLRRFLFVDRFKDQAHAFLADAIEQSGAVQCYDNGGKTADRFTVVYIDHPERQPNTFACIGMNHEPFHPQGIGQHSTATPGRHLGKRIKFQDLPADCQKAVRQDLQR